MRERADISTRNLKRLVREYAEASMEFSRKQSGSDHDALVEAYRLRNEAIDALARWGFTVDEAYNELAMRHFKEGS